MYYFICNKIIIIKYYKFATWIEILNGKIRLQVKNDIFS